MSDYICLNCRGGFPDPDPVQNGKCPWCGQSLDGSYEPPTVHSVSKVKNKDKNEDKEPLLSIFR